MVEISHPWIQSNMGYKLRPGPFVTAYLCIACGETFYDNPYLPTRVGISCPWCKKSHYTENGNRPRGARGARVRQVYKIIEEMQTLPDTPKRTIAISTLRLLAAQLIEQ